MKRRSVKKITITYINGKSYTVKQIKDLNFKNSHVTFKQCGKRILNGDIKVYQEDFVMVPTENILMIEDLSSISRTRVYKFKDGEIDTLNTVYK